MAIVFHCQHCGRKIEAADSAGGKWGKCPACHNRLYVPGPSADEEIKLAPVDETEEERCRRLMAETYQLTQDILQERDVPNGPAGPAGPVPDIDERDLTKNIIMYLRLMADRERAEAQRLLGSIIPHRRQAVRVVDRIALSELPEPELADIPQQVLSGLIRTLRAKIS